MFLVNSLIYRLRNLLVAADVYVLPGQKLVYTPTVLNAGFSFSQKFPGDSGHLFNSAAVTEAELRL